jgi:hypothetical protein
MPWIKRFGLHLAAAVGATGIFVGAVVVGASQARQQEPAPLNASASATRTPRTPRPTVVRTPGARTSAAAAASSSPTSPSPSPSSSSPQPAAAAPATTQKVSPERSLAGTIREVTPDGLVVLGVGGREWRVSPVAGALIRLNGKPARLETLQAGDTLVVLGQAQTGQGQGPRFVAHAITAKRK